MVVDPSDTFVITTAYKTDPAPDRLCCATSPLPIMHPSKEVRQTLILLP